MYKLKYQAHIAGKGWQDLVNEGEIAGTVGESRQLEAFRIYLDSEDGSGINAFAKCNGLNWSNVNVCGQDVGTTGLGVAMEAFKIGLTGPMYETHDIWYNPHVSGIGWMGWNKNGEVVGTEGSNGVNRIEAIQIKIMPKGKSWYGVDELASYKNVTPPPEPKKEQTSGSNFGPNEFKCSCGCGGDVTPQMKEFVQKLRNLLSQRAGHDMPLVITSGYRCPAQNRRDGGVSDSLHMEGTACDLYTPGMSRAMVDEIAYCARLLGGGSIRYYNQLFVHVQLEPRNTIGG